MFLQHKRSGNLVEILTPPDLWDPFANTIKGRFHAGEELQDPEIFTKSHLVFPSGEPLPLCWLNPNYRNELSAQRSMAMPR